MSQIDGHEEALPPLNLSGSARPFHLAKHLPELGWEPIIMTAGVPDSHRVDDDMRARVAELGQIVRIGEYTGIPDTRRSPSWLDDHPWFRRLLTPWRCFNLEKLCRNKVAGCVLGSILGGNDAHAQAVIEHAKGLGINLPDGGWRMKTRILPAFIRRILVRSRGYLRILSARFRCRAYRVSARCKTCGLRCSFAR